MPAPLEDATRAFYAALNDMLDGNVAPMLELWSHADDVTYMGPFGDLLVGWEPIRASWQAQAGQHLGGHVQPEELHHFASDALGLVVGFERGSVEIDGTLTPVEIRATSMYRVEGGRWVMIGHHTDPLS
jgi:ketosteroid isomerase-like protein